MLVGVFDEEDELIWALGFLVFLLALTSFLRPSPLVETHGAGGLSQL